MSAESGKRTFTLAVVVIVGVLVAMIAGKEVLFPSDGAGAPSAQAAKAAPPAKAGGKAGGPPMGAGGPPAPVSVAVVSPVVFSDAIEALGTAQAWESVTITASVTDTIRAIRFDSGDIVRRGQVLVQLDASEEAAALAEAEAAQVEADSQFQRIEALQARGNAPNAVVEERRANADRAEARVESARARVSDRVIRAPFAGVIGLRTASVGALVRPGDPIATLDDLSRIKLDFDVPESYIARLAPGVQIAARTTAYPGEVFLGEIDTVDSRVNLSTRNVRVRAVLDNRDARLRSGMLLTVEVRANPRTALAVPEISLLDQASGPAVYQLVERDGAPVAQLTPIRAGQRVAGMVEVLDGLQEGDRVVSEGVNRVRPGQPVRIASPPPAAAAAPARAPSR